MKYLKRIMFSFVSVLALAGFWLEALYGIWFRQEADHADWKFWKA